MKQRTERVGGSIGFRRCNPTIIYKFDEVRKASREILMTESAEPELDHDAGALIQPFVLPTKFMVLGVIDNESSQW